jgi:hypothetical protein
MRPRLANPKYCLAQSKQVGAEAENPRSDWAKDGLMRIARSYEFLAERAAARQKNGRAREISQQETDA